ncbi:ribonuclease H-like domain-containing protein [Clostridium sp. MB40-C1]|uniref:ribonuclease H-like domain-containing protein n=1 Tax=Clostridium sp. MB40-C1 TaxID=3070996 RepID=UPI0027E10F08|nr:ribonuclease H-like domain-containing protein [Clostridium sp. MB40-C1]WMJ80836.1 ribonuclease H-like domain-containing protein [Clostridium sp. MB40-C1]
MIKRENRIKVKELCEDFALDINGKKDLFKEALFFDLEHYLYKKPICIGVFGCCYYDSNSEELIVTQYMIEGKKDAIPILNLAKEYFIEMHEKYNKKYIVTFSGNNDYGVIDYLFDKNKIGFNIDDSYEKIDLQREYEKLTGENIGLKNLEKKFNIQRESELISGSNLSKTFCKVMKDFDYMNRMPEEKKQRILLYNEQDVASLFQIYVNWSGFLNKDAEEVSMN